MDSFELKIIRFDWGRPPDILDTDKENLEKQDK